MSPLPTRCCLGVLVLALVIATRGQICSARAAGKALKVVEKIVVGGAAAECLRRAGVSHEEYKQTDEVLERLRRQGVHDSDAAVFSLYLTLNNDASSVRWADVLNSPDIFFLVDLEGQGVFVVPSIHHEYLGQPVLETVLARHAKPGSRVLVRVMDDDCFSDAVWDSILRTKAKISPTLTISATQFLRIEAHTGTGIQLQFLRDGQRVVIDAPDHIAAFEFNVPETGPDGRWVAEGQLFDPEGRPVGSVHFAQVWTAPQTMQNAVVANQRAYGKLIFWGAGAVIAVATLVEVLRREGSTGASK